MTVITETPSGNLKTLEESLKVAGAPEPGDMKVGSVIEPDKGVKAPTELTVSQLTSAGWSYLYHAATGRRILVNNNMLLQKLRQKTPDGKPVFQAQKPAIQIKPGTHKCWLHQEDEQRQRYDEMGLPVCRKSNLISPFMVTQHMLKKHPQEYAAIAQERNEFKEKQKDLKDELLIKALTGKVIEKENLAPSRTMPVTEERPLYVSEKIKEDKPKRKYKR